MTAIATNPAVPTHSFGLAQLDFRNGFLDRLQDPRMPRIVDTLRAIDPLINSLGPDDVLARYLTMPGARVESAWKESFADIDDELPQEVIAEAFRLALLDRISQEEEKLRQQIERHERSCLPRLDADDLAQMHLLQRHLDHAIRVIDPRE